MAEGPKNTDDAKGKLKEGAGAVTGNRDLKNEGKVDQAAGSVKHGVDKAKDALTGKDD
jgi:uncharacterized protein YjbJ (UPF0337 family)